MSARTKDLSRRAGNLIRSIRTKQGLTQGELGAKLGVGKQAIHAVEHGRGRVTIDRLAEILDALGYRLPIQPQPNFDPEEDDYPVRSLVDVALRARESDEEKTFRHALNELYRYVAKTKDPLSILEEPVSTREERRDAYLAGVAEGIARYYDWDVPTWTNRDRYLLSEPYFPGAPEGMKVPLLQISPGYFRVRNIFVDDSAVVGPLQKFGTDEPPGEIIRG